MVKQRKTLIILPLAALLLASLACNFPTNRPQAPSTPVPVTTEAVQSLQENLKAAATEMKTGGPVTLTITEEQATSLLALETQSQEAPPVQDPQVLLRDGQIQVFGNVQQGNITAPLQLALTVHINGQGQPVFTAVSGSIGPLPLPEAMLKEISAQLDDALASRIRAQAGNITLDSITVANGVMTIVGHSG
jgi:uncharacterized protein YpmS